MPGRYCCLFGSAKKQLEDRTAEIKPLPPEAVAKNETSTEVDLASFPDPRVGTSYFIEFPAQPRTGDPGTSGISHIVYEDKLSFTPKINYGNRGSVSVSTAKKYSISKVSHGDSGNVTPSSGAPKKNNNLIPRLSTVALTDPADPTKPSYLSSLPPPPLIHPPSSSSQSPADLPQFSFKSVKK